MDADRFKEALTWRCVNHVHDEDVGKMARWTQDVITDACNFSMPIVTPVRRESVYWWSDYIAELRNACNQARRKWQRVKRKGHIEDILIMEEEYRSKKKVLSTEIRKAKTKAWNDLIQTIDKDPWGLPYRIVLKKLRRSNPSFGETLPLDILEQLVDRLFPQDPLSDEGATDEDAEEPWLEEYNINAEKICNILRRKAGANKAPGIDGIKSVFLKRISPEFLKELTYVYNQCLRRGIFPDIWKRSLLILIPKGEQVAATSKARPICLLSELGKLLESVIENRIQDWMERHPESQLAVNQFGFRKNTSTCDALLIVQEIVTDAKANGEIVVGISLDVTNAFNSIRWRNIRRALREKCFPQYLRRIISDYLSCREIEYPTINGTTITRKVTAGVPQGSILGPALWSITYDFVLRTPLEEDAVILGYADDIFIMAKAATKEAAIVKVNLQSSKVIRRIKNLGLDIAASKTGVVVFNDKNKTKNKDNVQNIHNTIYNIYIDREIVAVESTVKYLGLILDKDWSFMDHFTYIENKISRVSRALYALMPNLRGPRERKRRLYAHVIASIINYGAPIWSESTTNRKIREKLRRIQRVIAIRVIAGYRTISTDASLLMAKIVPADIHAAYFRRVFLRVHELKRQRLWNKLEERAIKREEEILLRRQWRIFLQRRDVAGVRTCRAIEPLLDPWLDRRHGELTFHTTQIIAGHGCF